MFVACHKAKKENKTKNGVFLEKSLDIEHSFLEEDFGIDNLSSGDKNH